MSRYANNTSDNTNNSERTVRRKSKKTLAVLLSCCLFLTITCACLLTALILIGKHLLYNSSAKILKNNNIKYATKHAIYRLPNTTVPIQYDITLKPYLETGDFKGLLNVTVNITEPRKELVLHSQNLSIDTVELVRANDSKVFHIGNIQENVISQVLVIIPKQIVPPGVYYLFFKYSGNMTNRIVGLYRSQYKNRDTGETR